MGQLVKNSKLVRMAQRTQNGPKWPKMGQRAQNDPKWPRGPKLAQRVSRMAQNGPWDPFGQGAQNCSDGPEIIKNHNIWKFLKLSFFWDTLYMIGSFSILSLAEADRENLYPSRRQFDWHLFLFPLVQIDFMTSKQYIFSLFDNYMPR